MPGYGDSVRHRPPPETSWWAPPGLSYTARTRLQQIAQRRMNASGKDLMPYGYGLEAKRQKPSADEAACR